MHCSKGKHRVCPELGEFLPGHGSKSPGWHRLAVRAIRLALAFSVALGAGGAWAEEPTLDTKVPAENTESAPGVNADHGGANGSGSVNEDSTAEPDASPDEQAPIPKEEVTQPHGTFDVVHDVISENILDTAKWLDSFFDDPRFRAEDNRTRVKIDAEYLWERGTTSDFRFPISAQLKLPKLQNRARFAVFGSPQQGVEGEPPPSGTAASKLPGAQQNNPTAALDYFFWATERLNIGTRVGVRFREGSPTLYVEPRYRQLQKFDPWAFRFTQDFKWWTDVGWESTTTFDLERPLGDKFFFRTTLQGAWTQEVEDIYHYSLAFNVRQILSPRRVVQYELVNGFETDKDSLKEIRATLRFREKIWRDWMFFEVAPYVSFRRDHDFDLLPGVLLRFEMIFGSSEGIGL